MPEEKFPAGWIVVDHIIPGVTTEMIDWWWVNMEKGYELWCPDEHKGFRWEVKPPLGGHIGAVQIATESIDYGPVRDLRIEWVDPNLGTQEQKDFWTYEHLLTAGITGAQPGIRRGSCFLINVKPFPVGARCDPACIDFPGCRLRASQVCRPVHCRLIPVARNLPAAAGVCIILLRSALSKPSCRPCGASGRLFLIRLSTVSVR